MDVTYSARSHVGRVRDRNEDNLCADGVFLTVETRERPFAIDGSTRAPALFAVCDGMGGEENGETASLLAVELLARSGEHIKSGLPADPDEPVQAYVRAANDAIRTDPRNIGKRAGTTLALAIVAESGVYCFNIGDSRIYCLKSDALEQVTTDHTAAAEKARGGGLAAERARSEKGGNSLTRCVGIGDMYAADSYPPIHGRAKFPFKRAKCRLLLCSDGLTDMASQSEIEAILKHSAKTSVAADRLLALALEHGGRDNITIIVADTTAPRAAAFTRGIADKRGK
jgi:protein phosphatase